MPTLVGDSIVHVLILENWQVDFHIASRLSVAVLAMVWMPGTSSSIGPSWDHWRGWHWTVVTFKPTIWRGQRWWGGAGHSSCCPWPQSFCNTQPHSWYDGLGSCLGIPIIQQVLKALPLVETGLDCWSWMVLMQVGWSEDTQVLLVWCIFQWWLGQSTASLHPGLTHWHLEGLVCQPSKELLTRWTRCPLPHPNSVLLMIATNRTKWPSLGWSLLLLLGQIYHLGPCLPQLASARHVAVVVSFPLSSVETTCISKQYQVSGWSGVCFLTRDWDGEHDGALPNASVSSGPFWLLGGVRVWPSVLIPSPDFWSSKSLNVAAIDLKQWLWIETPDKFIQFGCKGPCKKIKKQLGLH